MNSTAMPMPAALCGPQDDNGNPDCWGAALGGALADSAADALAAIAKDVQLLTATRRLTKNGQSTRVLSSGELRAVAMFEIHANIGSERPCLVDDSHIREMLFQECLDNTPTHLGLNGGLAGIGLLLSDARVNRRLDIEPTVLTRCDQNLVAAIEQQSNPITFDLLAGLAGIGVYSLRRAKQDGKRVLLDTVLAALMERAYQDDDGTAWLTTEAMQPPIARGKYPSQYVDLGVAHGVPGVIALLAGICAAGLGTDRVDSVLDSAVEWLIAQAAPRKEGDWFASFAVPGIAPHMRTRNSRLAWCYGDLGISVTIMSAARARARPDWAQFASDLALTTVDRTMDCARITGPEVCHGVAGVAQLFNHLYAMTADVRFANEVGRWTSELLKFRCDPREVGGFHLVGSSQSRLSPASLSLLAGVVGIGLVLLTLVSRASPTWDQMLGLSLVSPRRRPGI